MKPTTRSLIATVSGFVALGLFAMALIYWAAFTTPAFNLNIGQWDAVLRILAVGAIVAFSIYLVIAPESVGAAAAKRSNRLTANAALISVIAVGIGIAINIIAENVPTARADLTAGQDFTLSDQTLKVLGELDSRPEQVTAYGFFSIYVNSGVNQQQMEDLLKEYSARTGKMHYEFVDPVAQPAKASELGFDQRYGSVVFDNGKKRETAATATEADFTSAIVRLFQEEVVTVGYLTGHSERGFDSFEQTGYSSVRDQLTKENYQLRAISLLTGTITVSDTNVLIIASPKTALTERESTALQQYVDGGGRVLMLLDPEMTPEALGPMSAILGKYGVTPVPGIVIDLANNYNPQEPTILVVRNYIGTGITDDLSRNQLPTLFPLAMGLRPPTITVGSMVVGQMIQTSTGQDVSWLETDTQNPQAKYDAGTNDLPGPVVIGMQIQPSTTTTDTTTPQPRLVVYGDADFPSNLAVQLDPNNIDLFSNSVAWLSGQNELVSIRAKDPTAPRTMVLDSGQKSLIGLVAVFALPIVVLILGGYNWWRRR
ncbi:MAG: GldG family protein [Chloroflexia bacterium]